MKIIKNSVRILVIVILGILAFGLPSQTEATPNHVEPDQFGCAIVSEIPQIECEALVAIYHNRGIDNWDMERTWLQTNTPCSWHGLACGDGHIVELRLTRNTLNSMPAEIVNLSRLINLGFSLSGLSHLPPEIHNLNNLITLDLWDNQLSTLPRKSLICPI